jgi:hypothetical protein
MNNPYLNAAAASAYIGGVGLLMHYITVTHQNMPDTFLDPIAVISLFVCSAAVMAFLFFYRPTVLLLDNKKHQALTFFAKTIATFAVITAVILVVVVYF